jgi:xanthine dehydrogenase YagR molybdenum-binding subunit
MINIKEILGLNKDKKNAIDLNRQGLIGKDVDRVDGPIKVTGQAKYAYEYDVPNPAYGFIVGSTIAKGKISLIDASEAEKMPGVLKIMTFQNTPKQPQPDPKAEDKFGEPKPYLSSNEVKYYGEPVALVVADSFEEARAAASFVHVEYEKADNPTFFVASNKDKSFKPKGMNGGKPDSNVGDFQAAYDAAPFKISAIYTTPYQKHNAMEPHASTAIWQGKKLVIYSAQQLPAQAVKAIANTLKVSKDDVQVICKYVGGGFGGKLPVECDAILAAIAAREIKRPVKVAMTRQQIFGNTTQRPESEQHVRLGAEADGTLTSIAHECWMQTGFDEFTEPTAVTTRSLYAAPNRLTTHSIIKMDLPRAGSMRAPGEAIGMLAMEQGMDELAEKLNMDPIALRIKNDTLEDPEKKIPFSSRSLVPCLQKGAETFGWNKRNPKPGQMRDGEWLVGYGVASAIRTNVMRPSKARVKIDRSAHITVELAMTDIGTGSYTILTQIAAETMGVPMDQVTVILGDTALPETPGSGGSWGANSAGSGVYETCMALREKLVKLATGDKNSPLYKVDKEKIVFENSKLVSDNQSETLQSLLARTSPDGLEVEGSSMPPVTYKTYSQAAFGAHFAEVGVNIHTGEIRMRRMLGVFGAGRILNAKTARSQALGGMIWGISSALLEEAVVDPRYGNIVNHDLAEYHVPVHADIPEIEAIFLDEYDDKTGPLKVKGVGELGICGAGAAVANAVYNATGVRVREYPITLDKLIDKLPKAA